MPITERGVYTVSRVYDIRVCAVSGRVLSNFVFQTEQFPSSPDTEFGHVLPGSSGMGAPHD